MATVIKALGLNGELPLIVAFVILAVYAYSSGLRAPAAIAFIKDIMIYVAVVAAIAVIPIRLGGYAAVFDAADAAFKAKGSGAVILPSSQYVAYATLALGSALAAFMYPHTLTGVFASNGAQTIRKNAILLPAYTLLLGLLALLGYMAHAVQLDISDNNEVVPALFQALFPSWFAGFAFAAIAIGALVPAAVMSIGAANLFARNFWRAHIDPQISAAAEAQVAKIASLVVQIGAVFAVIFLPIQFALYLQLLGGMWIIQILPALVFGLYTSWFRAPALLAGWAAGILSGTYFAYSDGLKPLHAIHLGPIETTVYTALLALGVNIVVAVVVQTLPLSRVGSPAAKTRA
jgi:solute:Na+ symporter, SSS family